MRVALRDAAQAVAQLLLPVTCAGCGAPGHPLCPVCTAALVLQQHKRTLEPGLTVHSALAFEGTVAAVLHAIKRDHRVGLVRYLAPALAVAVDRAASEERNIALLPIPQSARAWRDRGFWPVQELATAAHLPLINALRLVRTPADQRGLSRTERANNMEGAFALDFARLRGATSIVLLDDVVTTGATLRSAATACHSAGVCVLAAATAVTTLAIHAYGSRTAATR